MTRVEDIPYQAGRIAIVTGSTGGLGYETALALAGAHARVIVAGRNAARGWNAVNAIRAAHPHADVRFEALDLASLASVRAFSAKMHARDKPVQLLVNNAGVMALPARRLTGDGFEMQIATNYLGHFALTAQLLPLLLRGTRSRVVSLSSIAHRSARINLDDLQNSNYNAWRAYGQTKLAMLMFALELQRQSDMHGWGLMSNAAHPGWARTELFANGPNTGSAWTWQRALTALAAPFLSHSAEAGALPTLYAATSPDAKGGVLYGPDGFSEMKGPPSVAQIAPQALDQEVAANLWELSASLTGVPFPAATPAACVVKERACSLEVVASA
jgi:NAD(P)-dependent dehydrogenase (short-subunit alcohol dehydrogenase family)